MTCRPTQPQPGRRPRFRTGSGTVRKARPRYQSRGGHTAHRSWTRDITLERRPLEVSHLRARPRVIEHFWEGCGGLWLASSFHAFLLGRVQQLRDINPMSHDPPRRRGRFSLCPTCNVGTRTRRTCCETHVAACAACEPRSLPHHRPFTRVDLFVQVACCGVGAAAACAPRRHGRHAAGTRARPGAAALALH